jgi:hypothetical protein
MDVALLCPLVTGIVRWNAPEPLLTVIVKGTFSLTGPGAGGLAPEQEPLYVDWPWDSDPGSELERPSDFVPRKPRADVFVVGHARGAEASTTLPLYIEVKGVPQRLRKHATAMSSAPNTKIPLSGTFLRDAEGTPLRLGPVPGPSAWRGRVDGSFDFSRFNTAPGDQQIPTVASGCRLVLIGLIEEADPCELRIAPLEPSAYVATSREPGAIGQAVPLRCDTLFIDTERALCTLTWRGEISAPTHEHAYLVVGARDNTGPSWPEVFDGLGSATWAEAIDEEATLDALGVEKDGPPTDPQPKMRPKADTIAMAPALPPKRARALTIDKTVDPADGAEALPFRRADRGTAPPPAMTAGETDDTDDDDSDETISLTDPARVLPPHVIEALARVGELKGSGVTTGAPVDAKNPLPFRAPGDSVPVAVSPEVYEDDFERPRETIAPPAMGSSTIALDEDGSLRAMLVAATAVPFVKPSEAPPSAAAMAEEADVEEEQHEEDEEEAPETPKRPRRQRTETTTLSHEQVQDLQAQVAAGGVLPWQSGGETPSALLPEPSSTLAETIPPPPGSMPSPALPETIPPPPGSIPFAQPPASQPTPAIQVPHVVPPPNPAARAMGWQLGQALGTTSPLSPKERAAVGTEPQAAGAAKASVPRHESLPLARYAVIKGALLDDGADLRKLLADEGITERDWRLHERHMAIELARDAAHGGGALADKVRRAIDKARLKRQNTAKGGDESDGSLENDVDQYCTIRAEIEEAEDPAVALRELGLSHEAWATIRRGWSGRCLADAALAVQVRERLAEARNTLRRQGIG